MMVNNKRLYDFYRRYPNHFINFVLPTMVGDEMLLDFFRYYPDYFIELILPELKLSFFQRIYWRIMRAIYL